MGTMRILDETGDTCVAWTVDDPTSVANAERAFAHHRRRGVAFARHAGEPAGRARPISAFDPAVEEIIWTRPITGG